MWRDDGTVLRSGAVLGEAPGTVLGRVRASADKIILDEDGDDPFHPGFSSLGSLLKAATTGGLGCSIRVARKADKSTLRSTRTGYRNTSRRTRRCGNLRRAASHTAPTMSAVS